MDNRTLNLDFYNNSYYVRSGNIQYAWFSLANFVADTSFPHDSSLTMISYEPGRNIYVVEKENQVYEYGTEVAEIQWITANFDAVLELGRVKQLAEAPVITMEMYRQVKLYEADWIIQRHQEETILNIDHKLTNEQYIAVLTYKQQLRDLTDTYPKDTLSENVVWPVDPLVN